MKNKTALVTGVGRKAGIGTAIAERLKEDGPRELAGDPGVRAALPRTARHGAGRIVTLTSDAVVHNVPYGASKGALDRITLAAARELGRAGTPQDCAGLVAFLCGLEGGWVNGQVLVANGGAA